MSARQALLRPDQAAAAVTMAQAGATAAEVAVTLSVPAEVVERSLRVPASTAPEEAAPALELGMVLIVGERRVGRALPRPKGWRAAVFVEDDLSWPPSADESTRWSVLPVRVGNSDVRTAMRQAVLWGEAVMVDVDRRVFCPTCRGLVDPAEMGRDQFGGYDGVRDHRPGHRLGMPPAQWLSAGAVS